MNDSITKILSEMRYEVNQESGGFEISRSHVSGWADRIEELIVEPMAYMREWEGDESDLGNMIFETDRNELDINPNWIPLFHLGEQVKWK